MIVNSLWPQPDRRALQLLQQLPCIILVDAVLQQCLRHLPDRSLHDLQINQWRQRKLLAPAPLAVRLLLMLVASVRALYRGGLALLPIPAEPLAPPIIAIPLLNYLAWQRFTSILTGTSVHHQFLSPLLMVSRSPDLPITAITQ
jgi:hypothetical protein